MEFINKILKEKNIFAHNNEDITIATVASLHDGFALAQEILYGIVDLKTVLYLSGGSTPKVLYERFTVEEKLSPGAVGVVDERFGNKFHATSNEKMFRETGLLRYLEMRNIPFYPILQGKSREETVENYDEKLRTLNATYQKSVAILGIGTASQLMVDAKHALVAGDNDRIGMTFLGLSMLDVLLVLVFGEEKKKSLELMFTEGSEGEIPERFFKRPDVAKKTLFITDQRI